MSTAEHRLDHPHEVSLRVGSSWTEAASGATYDCLSPVDGELYARIANGSVDDVGAAVQAGAEAFAEHRDRSAWERAEMCHRIADRVEARAEEIARTVTYETGRTVGGALDEVSKAVYGFRLAGEEVLRLHGEVIPVRDPAKTVFSQHLATGVWAVLTPFNFPVNIPVEYLGPAIASGNTVVWKPSPSASASAALMVACMVEAGLPPGVVNLLTTNDRSTAERLVSHPDVAGIALTGSTPTGQAVERSAVGKQLILELGGNGPMIVFGDADLDRAAAAVASSCFMASGQLCSAGGRILTERAVAGELAERVAALTAQYPLGDPFVEGTVLGPLHTTDLSERVRQQVADARTRGAAVLTGGAPATGFPNNQYFPATVLTDVTVDSDLNLHETFGPVAPIIPLEANQLVESANAGAHALSTAVFTSDIDRAMAAAQQLRFGAVVVNDRSSYWELHLPYGGWLGKSSGQGRVGVPAVLRQMSQSKIVAIDTRPSGGTDPGGDS